MAQRIQRIGVVGFGLMGSGIAQLCATAGFPVRVREITPELARRGLDSRSAVKERIDGRGSSHARWRRRS